GLFAFLRLGFGSIAAAGGVLFLLAGNAQHERTGNWMNTTTYSPWLWAPYLGQGLFFLCLFLFVALLFRPARSTRVALGVCWAFTFMAHTSAAIAFGGIYLVVMGWETLRHRADPGAPLRTQLLHAAVPIATAFVASLPYTYSILWNY